MHWLVKCRSKPNTDALRLATIDAHRNFLDGYPEVTWYSGPLFTDDNKNAIGSLRLIEFPDRAAARAYIDADPYTRAGIFAAITIERWKPVLDVRQRDYVRKQGTMQFVIHCHERPDGEARQRPDGEARQRPDGEARQRPDGEARRGPDGGARRAALRDAHHAWFDDHRDIIVTRGPLLDDGGAKTIGRLVILDVADKAEADAFWAGEPFNRAGLYEWTMERWRFGHV